MYLKLFFQSSHRKFSQIQPMLDKINDQYSSKVSRSQKTKKAEETASN